MFDAALLLSMTVPAFRKHMKKPALCSAAIKPQAILAVICDMIMPKALRC